MGSQVSLITDSLMNRMRLRRQPSEVRIEGVGSCMAIYSKGSVTVQMQATTNGDMNFRLSAYVVPAITSTTPSTAIDPSSWSHLRDLKLADPTFGTPGRVDVLLGADVLNELLLEGFIQGSAEQPCALNTTLGWIVFGPASSDASPGTLQTSYMAKCNEQRLDELLRSFWELEEQSASSKPQVDECDKIFNDTFTRTPDGRYQVQIVFRPDAPPLGESYRGAVRQFLRLERRLLSDHTLREQYVSFMREYLTLEHMEETQGLAAGTTDGYFIPHHAVTTKFRVVFNASAKTSSGVSLNDIQLSGPQLHPNLVDIFYRFRKFSVAITADVKKMFRQVLVDPRHRKWQKIIWREAPDEPLKTYELKTVTYGMACSPFNAIRALRQCANDNCESIDDTSRAAAARHSILNSFYVDDYLDSVDTAELAIIRAQDVGTILKQGHFILGKWNSNCAHTLTTITGSKSSASELELNGSETKVLGLHWDPVRDELFFKVRDLDESMTPTKRTVLSDVARLYDPTGMLAPVVVVAKLFIQDLWKAGLQWDAGLPQELLQTWLHFRNSLPQLAMIRIPRWVGIRVGFTVRVHGFCDASCKAYAAAVYIQSIDNTGASSSVLVAAKTRIAPLKEATIPRLELCGAHLLTILMNNVRQSLDLQDTTCTYWCDSTIVLCWIRKAPSTFKQYVSNRVDYIQNNSDVSSWRHVRSEFNPADCASRGLSPAEFASHQLWWTGPSVIHEDLNIAINAPTLTEEERRIFVAESRPMHILASRTDGQWLMTTASSKRIPLVEKISNLTRLLNITARLRRLLPSYHGLRGDEVSAKEQYWALLLHIKQAQGNVFNHEIKALLSHSRLESRSKLLALNPFLDSEGILRVGGRLTNTSIDEDARHPMIVPRGALAGLLVADAHKRCLHGGIQQMLQFLRQRFWLLCARAQVKAYSWRCTICRRYLKTTQRQQMAALPKERVLVAPPFSCSGLDYCGPFHVRLGAKRSTVTTKTYAAIFVCMASRAVHIELAENLSTQAFIEAYDRFVSRRGICATLYSDNGTQFVGANNQMKEDLKAWRSVYAKQHLSNAGTQWKFIPPAAPHHGGLWEAAVRSAKKHLLRVMGRQTLRFNELYTLLTRIEACLNSRPLIALYDDPEGGLALTPGDFLIGRPLNSRPEPPLPEVPSNRLRYWQRLQQMLEHFWRRWQAEYLHTLQARGKWARPEPNIQRDDVVLICNENLPPTFWRIGRVTDVHPGRDGLVRTATVEYNTNHQSANGILGKHRCQRPIQKLCRLTGPSEELLNHAGSAGQDVQDSNKPNHRRTPHT